MKGVLSCTILAVMASCSSVKNSSESNTEEFAEYTKVTVTSEYKEEGCDYLLKTEEDLYNPYNLTEEFKQANIEVYIKFKPTRMPQPGDCGKGTPILLDTIFAR